MNKITTLLILVTFLIRTASPLAVLAAPDLPSVPDTTSSAERPGDEPARTPAPTPVATVAPESTPLPTATPVPAVQALSTTSSSPAPTPNQQVSDQLGGNVDIATGDVSGTGTITNTGNNNSVDGSPTGAIADASGTPSISLANEGNLANSTNSASVTGDTTSTTVQDNNANLDNDLNIDSGTGNNIASNNLANTSITSGDAFAAGTIANMVNTNSVGAKIAEFNILEDQRGDYLLDFDKFCVIGCGAVGGIDIANAGNGADSTNTGMVTLNDQNETFQNNDANVENNMVLAANTGNNSSVDNIGDQHTINTGDATVSASILNFLNNNFYGDIMLGVVNIFGDYVGDIVVPEEYSAMLAAAADINLANTGNGSGSTNTASYYENGSDSYNQANLADIVNNINVGANSGGNVLGDNILGDHTIETGDTNVDVNLLNIANNNFIGNNWWFVIVNEAGNWVGKLIALPGATVTGNMAASQGTQYSVDNGGNVDIANQGNAANSTNTGSVAQTTDNTVNQNNNAQIVNNLDLSANTGYNDISKNLGDTHIITGDANAMVNIVNFVNNNFIGSNVFVTVVNVFGSWVGDFITPGAQKPVVAASNNQGNQENNQTSALGGISPITTLAAANLPVPTIKPAVLSTFSSAPQVSSYSTPGEEDESEQTTAVLAYSNNPTVAAITEPTSDKVRINLAWLLPIGIVGIVGYMIKRRITS